MGPSKLEAIDVDDMATWPEALHDALQGNPEPSSLDRFAAAVGDRPLRGYHSTRLLPHEVNRIRKYGLLMLTPSLVQSKIEDAVRNGALMQAQADNIRAGSILEVPYRGTREGQVCAVIGQTVFDDPSAVSLLLSTWGGEGIYFLTPSSSAHQPVLRSLGTPSIVVVNLSVHSIRPSTLGDLQQVFRSRLEGGHDYFDVFHLANIPASAVADIWQPGDPSYDRFEGLPHG